MSNSPYTVYGMSLSGNCHKVRLILDLSGTSYEWHETDTRDKATRTPEYLAMNPAGEVPLLITPDGRRLPQSNAILYYIATVENTRFWPEDEYARARTLQWMFFEQYSHEPYIAVNRARLSIFKDTPADDPGVLARHAKGKHALSVMNQHLSESPFFGGEQISIADIALFAYTHVADEGGFTLGDFPKVATWLERLYNHGGFMRMARLD